jgi:type IV pilus biogenesis protein CpaD/CtpE
MNRPLRAASLLALLILLSGCGQIDPFEDLHAWRATGVNESNLAQMAANPADLAHGRGTGPADGLQAAAAIERLRHDQVKSLSSVSGGSAAASGAAALTSN